MQLRGEIMIALFLGAGFSKGIADLPVSSELFDFDVEPWGPREYKKLEVVKLFKHNWDISHPYGLTEQFIADALNSQKNTKEAVLWYITRRISKPFIWKEFYAQRWRRHVLMIDENRRFNINGVNKARGFLQRFYGLALAGIVTTNYDMLVEYALGTKGFNYGVPNQTLMGRGPYPISQWKNPVILSGRVPLAKIHGSISWDENAYYTDGRRGLTGNALIVAPTREKQPSKSLKFVWRLAKNILEKSTQLVIFGFAFNPYDETVLNLLKTGGKNLETVVIIDIKPRMENAHHLWSKAKILSIIPQLEKDRGIQELIVDIRKILKI